MFGTGGINSDTPCEAIRCGLRANVPEQRQFTLPGVDMSAAVPTQKLPLHNPKLRNIRFEGPVFLLEVAAGAQT